MIEVVWPKPIPSNGLLGAFTPSDPILPERRVYVERNVAALKQLGLQVVFSKHAFDCNGHISADSEYRVQDIIDLISDPFVNALIATCGGKSTNSLLLHFDYTKFLHARKPIIGFSDAGVLLNAITAKTGLVTFYGPNVLSKLHQSKYADLSLLRQHSSEYIVHRSDDAYTLCPGDVHGRLVGGNLSTFTVGVAGTEYEPQYRNTILFWESGTDEWRLIDQHLASLEVRGVLRRIKGMIIGKIGDTFHLDQSGIKFLRQRLSPLGIPVLWLPIFGHGEADNPIWPIGGEAYLNATEKYVALSGSFVEA